MRTEFISKNYRITERFKDVVQEKLSKLDKYFDKETSAKVFASTQNKSEKLEITIVNKGLVYRGEVVGESMFANIDIVLPKIEKQIVRTNQKDKEKNRKAVVDYSFEFITEQPEELAEVYKKKTFDLDPETVEDAKYMIERLDHQFYVFLNAESGKVNVLYKRKDNKYGLIEVKF